MPKNKHVVKGILLLFVALIATAIYGGSAYAATTNGIITDANGIRWEYELTDGESAALSIMFYDKPADLSRVTVPSYSELLSLVPGAPADLDTYFLKNADPTAQDTAYPGETRRQATVDTTILDMQNTSKIQILGVKPIIDPEVETELIFGPNMVISDGWYAVEVEAQYCTEFSKHGGTPYYCDKTETRIFSGVEDRINKWQTKSDAQRESYQVLARDFGCTGIASTSTAIYNYSEGKCFVLSGYTAKKYLTGRAFSGYKLKLTNFDAANFNYVGWETFMNSTFNAANTTMTISGNTLLGSDIFKNTNITKAIVNTETVGSGVFRDCASLTEVVFDDSITRIRDSEFAGTGLTSMNFANTNIRTIEQKAFEGAHLSEVDFTGIERIEYQAFKDTNIAELYLPKSINWLSAEIFMGDGDLRKLTVAYDTLTSGTTLPMFVVLDNVWGGGVGQPTTTLEELIVIAPYAEDEELSPTHVSYQSYQYNYDKYQNYTSAMQDRTYSCYGYVDYTPYGAKGPGGSYCAYYDRPWQGYYNYGFTSMFEWDYGNLSTKKNIIAPLYFSNLHGLKKITVGEGFEFIGASAFIDHTKNDYSITWESAVEWDENGYLDEWHQTKSRMISEINLPDSLKGVGNLAFESIWSPNLKMTIPQGIEFIGMGAFRRVFHYSGDVDFPNLVALGDNAFESTLVKNIVLHDKLQYMGIEVFRNSPNINNITFDFDVFNPSSKIIWAGRNRTPSYIDSYFMLSAHFGENYGWMRWTNDEDLARWGIKKTTNPFAYGSGQVFGTITFTDKNVSEIPRGYGLQGDSGSYNTFFGGLTAKKIDIGETNWKLLSPRMFEQSMVDEIILPKNLEVIPRDTFNSVITKEEITIPDSVIVIADRAFNCEKLLESGIDTPIITKLPSSLRYVGAEAFYGDTNLTADLNSPNLERIYIRAFQGTRLRDVTLPSSLTMLLEGTFADIPTLRNITIDCDLASFDPIELSYTENWDGSKNFSTPESGWADFDFPESLLNFVNGYGWAYHMIGSYMFDSNAHYREGYYGGDRIASFYTVFNQSMKADEEVDGEIVYGQLTSGDSYGRLVFTENATTSPRDFGTGYFSGLSFDVVDLSQTGWTTLSDAAYAFNKAKIGTLILPEGLEEIPEGAFFEAEITDTVLLPDTLKTIGDVAFQWADVIIENTLPEGVETIGRAAFFGTDVTDELTIPASVTTIGKDAFNAGSETVSYDTLTIKPDLNYSNTSDQLIHQIFYGAGVDKLVVDSAVLPALAANETDSGHEEFWSMTMSEAEINNLSGISTGAFMNCTNLEKVDMGEDSALRSIGSEAFINDSALDTMIFSPAIKNETVTIGTNAFKNTAFTSIGDANADFDLTAAKFDGSLGFAFANMPKVTSVKVPASFSNATIPMASFANDGELVTADIDYHITEMHNEAFSNDNKLKRIFIWGNTKIYDTNLPGYDADAYGHGGDDDEDEPEYGPTIPEGTDIYAYSTSPARYYAEHESRAGFDGTFYPLDEVLYLSSNKKKVKINDTNDDFDKDGVTIYALRRDGIILESSTWGEYDGTAFPRSTREDIHFDKILSTVATDPDFGTIWDTPVPLNELDLTTNVNFENIDYDLIMDEATEGVKLVNVKYTDKYTNYVSDTDLEPYIEELIPDGPVTLAQNVFIFFAIFAASWATVFALKGRRR